MTALLWFALAAAAPPPAVCSDPAHPGPGFKPHDLSFALPKDGVPREEIRSAPFYAVILRTLAPCTITEAERAETQKLWAHNKVFATRFQCDGDVENNVGYSGVDPKHGFLAVYAGDIPATARAFLAEVKRTGKFPGANLRKMQVVVAGS
jgi:hypothetical protein